METAGAIVPASTQYSTYPVNNFIQTRNTRSAPVQDFDDENSTQNLSTMLQRQHLSYRQAADPTSDSNNTSIGIFGSLENTSSSPLITSAPTPTQIYSTMMQKAKILVHAFSTPGTDEEQKSRIYEQLLQLNHNFDQIIFGEASEAKETLRQKEPPKFIRSSVTMALTHPYKENTGRRKRRERTKKRFLDYESDEEDLEKEANQTKEDDFRKEREFIKKN